MTLANSKFAAIPSCFDWCKSCDYVITVIKVRYFTSQDWFLEDVRLQRHTNADLKISVYACV